MPPAKQSLSQKILAVLDASPIPVTVPDLMLLCGRGYRHPRKSIWSALIALERSGLVRRRVQVNPGRSRTVGYVGSCVRCGTVRKIECRGICRQCYKSELPLPNGEKRCAAKLTFWSAI